MTDQLKKRIKMKPNTNGLSVIKTFTVSSSVPYIYIYIYAIKSIFIYKN